jgi:sporulation protein YlmC with PRC-barrel domain
LDADRSPLNKLVLDWNNVPVGKIRDARVDPRTRAVERLVVSLSGEARRRLDAATTEVVIPVRMVHSIRRGEVVLDRSLASAWRDLPTA